MSADMQDRVWRWVGILLMALVAWFVLLPTMAATTCGGGGGESSCTSGIAC